MLPPEEMASPYSPSHQDHAMQDGSSMSMTISLSAGRRSSRRDSSVPSLASGSSAVLNASISTIPVRTIDENGEVSIVRVKTILRVKTNEKALATQGILKDELDITSDNIMSITKTVKFKKVYVREYQRVVGDNPSCSSGPPLSIGWEYRPQYTFSLDRFEHTRGRRRQMEELIVDRHDRVEILMEEWKVPRQDMIEAVRENIRTKNQRRRTVNNMGVEKMDIFWESAFRKVKRTLLFRKRTSVQIEALMKNSQLVGIDIGDIDDDEKSIHEMTLRSRRKERNQNGKPNRYAAHGA